VNERKDSTNLVADNLTKSKFSFWQIFSKYQSLIILLTLSVFFSFISDNFLTLNNIWIILRQTSVNLCLAVGMTFVILTGGIDLSVGSILGFSGAVTAKLLWALQSDFLMDS